VALDIFAKHCAHPLQGTIAFLLEELHHVFIDQQKPFPLRGAANFR